MINNLKQATPPRGMSAYDGAFEVLAEGEINRIIALFYDYESIPEIGSVRSARDYYFKLARPLDPIVLHYGGSDAAYIYIKQNKLDTLNGMESNVDSLVYWRDQQRIKSAGYEHSVFTSGEKVREGRRAARAPHGNRADGTLFPVSRGGGRGQGAGQPARRHHHGALLALH